ncbi:hypothetical protein GCM10009647_063100 [Streptomyces sanglieri]
MTTVERAGEVAVGRGKESVMCHMIGIGGTRADAAVPDVLMNRHFSSAARELRRYQGDFGKRGPGSFPEGIGRHLRVIVRTSARA